MLWYGLSLCQCQCRRQATNRGRMMGSSGQRLTHLNRLCARAQMKGAVIVAKAMCGRVVVNQQQRSPAPLGGRRYLILITSHQTRQRERRLSRLTVFEKQWRKSSATELAQLGNGHRLGLRAAATPSEEDSVMWSEGAIIPPSLGGTPLGSLPMTVGGTLTTTCSPFRTPRYHLNAFKVLSLASQSGSVSWQVFQARLCVLALLADWGQIRK